MDENRLIQNFERKYLLTKSNANRVTTSVKIYRSIKDSCLELATGDTKVKTFALWNNQIDKLKSGEQNPVRFPSVFISFENQFEQLSSGYQSIDGIFILYLALESLKFSDEEILKYKDNLYSHLSHSLPKKGFENFTRAFEVQDTAHDNIMVWQMEVQYRFIDDGGKNKTTVHPLSIDPNLYYSGM